MCVLGELGARVEREEQAARELEDDDRSGRFGLAAYVLVGDDPFRREAEPIAVERECTLEVVDGERDDVYARLHVALLPEPRKHAFCHRRPQPLACLDICGHLGSLRGADAFGRRCAGRERLAEHALGRGRERRVRRRVPR